jgi:hypothetical protein
MMRDNRIHIPVTWRLEWQDGFGARGWKLDYSLDDPYVIATTAETGKRIPTSVLVHDILDHYLCGLPLSGHRNEAMALVQLGLRTGSSPQPDFAGMVDEDLLHGHVNGEPMRTFLPDDLLERLPANEADGRRMITLLCRQLGKAALRERLIQRFFELGKAETGKIRSLWKARGPDYGQRGAMGLALQRILELADRDVCELALEEVRGKFMVADSCCALDLTHPVQQRYQSAV